MRWALFFLLFAACAGQKRPIGRKLASEDPVLFGAHIAHPVSENSFIQHLLNTGNGVSARQCHELVLGFFPKALKITTLQHSPIVASSHSLVSGASRVVEVYKKRGLISAEEALELARANQKRESSGYVEINFFKLSENHNGDAQFRYQNKSLGGDIVATLTVSRGQKTSLEYVFNGTESRVIKRTEPIQLPYEKDFPDVSLPSQCKYRYEIGRTLGVVRLPFRVEILAELSGKIVEQDSMTNGFAKSEVCLMVEALSPAHAQIFSEKFGMKVLQTSSKEVLMWRAL